MARDLRRYAAQTNRRLVVGGLVLLFTLGLGLIYIFFGRGPALTGFVCLLLGLSPLVLIWFALWLVGWIAKRGQNGT